MIHVAMIVISREVHVADIDEDPSVESTSEIMEQADQIVYDHTLTTFQGAIVLVPRSRMCIMPRPTPLAGS